MQAFGLLFCAEIFGFLVKKCILHNIITPSPGPAQMTPRGVGKKEKDGTMSVFPIR